jgi:4,5-dihydroxyphthalate decarboxylase
VALRLKTTCAPNPRIDALVSGEVRPDGIEFDWHLQPVPMLFCNNIRFDDLEFSEMSISETLLAIERRPSIGNGRWNWWAIPIYLSRGHFWTSMLVNKNAAIKDLGDLKGKQVGVPDYCMTAALWMKVTLKDLYGIDARDISWHNMRPRGESQALELQLDRDPPPGVTINWLNKDQDPAEMLVRGELDAAIGLENERLAASANVQRLLPDRGRELIFDYYRKTGCFQPNHHYIIQRRLVDDRPEVPMQLYDAFERSKRLAYEGARKQPAAYLYFEGNDFAEQASIIGDDPYPMGLKAMGKTLQRLIQGSLEQGLIRRPVRLDEVYHPSTLAT